VVIDDQNSCAIRLVRLRGGGSSTRQGLADRSATGVRQPAHGFFNERKSADSSALKGSNAPEALRGQVSGATRNPQCDRGSDADFTMRLDAAAMEFHKFLHQGESDAGAFMRTRVRCPSAKEA